jgi:hypothetical protein
MINSRIFGIVLVLGAVATPIFVVATSQNAIASILDEEADVDVAEAADSGNATAMMTNQTSDGNTTGVEFLSIQTAQSGSISEINATTSTLEMSNVSDSTILFSDRPDRIVSSVSTSDFTGNWTTGPNSFAADAPNAALVTENTQTGELDTAIIELFNPMYNTTMNTLTYTIMAENATSIAWPGEFGHTVLVIDSPPCNPSPNGANGLSLNDCGY